MDVPGILTGKSHSKRWDSSGVETRQLDLTTLHDRIEAAVDLVEAVHRAIDWESFGAGRRMGYWGELEAKVNAYAKRNLSQFLWRISSAFGARAPEGPRLLMILEAGHDREILKVLAKESTLITLKLRERINRRKEGATR